MLDTSLPLSAHCRPQEGTPRLLTMRSNSARASARDAEDCRGRAASAARAEAAAISGMSQHPTIHPGEEREGEG
eukprot:8107930-Pyramimonas_sp.AAC.1